MMGAMLHASVLIYLSFMNSRAFISGRALSNLGMPRSPYAHILNVYGFIIPGIMLLVFSLGAYSVFGLEGRLGALGLAFGAASFSMAGLLPFPNASHFAAVMGACAFLALGIALLAIPIARTLRWPSFQWASYTVVLLVVGNLDLPLLFGVHPGYYQLLSISACMAWLLCVSGALFLSANPPWRRAEA